jgi:hypothetical protein
MRVVKGEKRRKKREDIAMLGKTDFLFDAETSGHAKGLLF